MKRHATILSILTATILPAALAQDVEVHSAAAGDLAGVPAPVRAARLPRKNVFLNDPPVLTLPEFSAAERNLRLPGGGAAAGRGRRVSTPDGAWETMPDGRRVWRASLRSVGAEALRVKFTSLDLGSGRLWVYAAGVEDPGDPITGRGPYGTGDFWSSLVFADSAIIEYEPAAAGQLSSGLPFRIEEAGHFFTAPAAPALPRLIANGPATSAFQGSLADAETPQPVCHVDVNCAPQNWRKVGKAVAIMYTYAGEDERGETIWQTCTGTLLNNAKGSGRPYFLTANHCVADNQQAQDTVVVWNYESIGCDGAPFVMNLVQQRVARLLATGDLPRGDYSLLLLEGRAAPGTVLAGWTTAEPAMGAALVGIHHPNFSWKRISGGNRYPDQGFGTELPAESYYQIRWQSGHTEGGSSGSGLFNASGQLVGTLFGGDSYCNMGQDLYGRLRVYFGQLRRYLVDDQL